MASEASGKTSRTTDGPRRNRDGHEALPEVLPATPDRWTDVERLVGRSGACSGCGCICWRLSSAQFAANGNAGNLRGLEQLARSGAVPGLLGYRGIEPAGWISIAPRAEFGTL